MSNHWKPSGGAAQKTLVTAEVQAVQRASARAPEKNKKQLVITVTQGENSSELQVLQVAERRQVSTRSLIFQKHKEGKEGGNALALTITPYHIQAGGNRWKSAAHSHSRVGNLIMAFLLSVTDDSTLQRVVSFSICDI